MRVATQDYFGILYNFTVFLYLTVGQLVKLGRTEFIRFSRILISHFFVCVSNIAKLEGTQTLSYISYEFS